MPGNAVGWGKREMLEGNRVGILVEEGFEDSELVEVARAMSDAGAVVVTIGSGSFSTYRGLRGKVRAKVDVSAQDIRADQLDAVVIVGGYAADKMRLHQAVVDLVKEVQASGKVLGAIGHGPQLLISAGVVKGKRVTSWPSIAVDLANAGAIWADEPVVQDGNLVTAGKPSDLPRFNKAVIDALRKRAVRV
ncbi:MAG: type 1 glutamine amidotransferase domain-containing protein [Dehalococcoidia bacterium]|nr:type 1 glutamine amidotransferase domain-containing protein [Dehalococcoidia bacterium]